MTEERYLVINDNCECQKCEKIIKEGDFVYYLDDNFPCICYRCLKWLKKQH